MTNAVTTRLLGDRKASVPLQPRRDRANALYRRAVFALDARRTPGSSAAGNTIQDLSTNALRTQSGTTGNAKIVQDGRGGKALRTHGSATGFASTPDSAATSVTSGVLGIRAWFRHNSWAPSANEWVLGKWIAGTNQRSYGLGVSGTTGRPFLSRSLNGTAGSSVAATANLAAAQPDGWYGIGVDRDPATGTCTFFESSDGVTWTQLGSPVADTAGNLFDGTASLVVGVLDASGPLNGLVGWVKVYDDSTLVADFDPSRDASFSSLSWASSTTGETWTVTPGGSDNSDATYLPAPSTLGVDRYVYLPAGGNNILTTPDAAALDITGDIDLRAYVNLESWTSGSDDRFVAKLGTAGQHSYRIRITGGSFRIEWSPDGTSVLNLGTAPGWPPNVWRWVRATLDVDNGAGGHEAKFYTSTVLDPGPADWTLVDTKVGVGTTSIFAGTNSLFCGYTVPAMVGRMQVFDGIDGNKVFDWSAEDTVTATHSAFTASTGQTVTVNRATSGRKTVVVEAAKWLLGTDDYIEVADNALLDLDAATDFTVLAVLRQHATPTSQGRWVDKRNATVPNLGWSLRSNNTLAEAQAVVTGQTAVQALTLGSLSTIGLRVSGRSASAGQVFVNGTLGSTFLVSGGHENSIPMRIGRVGDGTNYQDFELYAVYVWREALTASELAAIAADWGAV